MKFFLFILLLVLPAFSIAGPLSFPLKCEYGKDCFIQNYVDADPTNNYMDYGCNFLTYNGNEGADFRLKNYVQMKKGVEVIAAADGVVTAIRDEMPDINANLVDEKEIKDRSLGNVVMVNHGDGISIAYSHLMFGSISVSDGEKVKSGQTLGLVGLSGNTVFPHLNFVVKKDGKVIDPFSGKKMGGGCDEKELKLENSMWDKETFEKLKYMDAVFLGSGAVDYQPKDEEIRATDKVVSFNKNSPMLIFWVDIMGLRANDNLVMKITSPTGTTIAENQTNIDSPKATYFKFIGKRNANKTLLAGDYNASAQIIRNGKIVSQVSQVINVAD